MQLATGTTMDRLRSAYSRLDRLVSAGEEWILALCVIGALIALLINVLLRYGFHHSLPWAQELVREVIIVTTLLGCSLAVKRGQQVSVDAAAHIFPNLRRFLAGVHYLATLAFALLLIHFGWEMVIMMQETNQRTIAMHIPLAWIYAVLPVTGLLMTIRSLQALGRLRHSPF
jgi:TRAP-type C4-dicarboxylate transport system permease small subunit